MWYPITQLCSRTKERSKSKKYTNTIDTSTSRHLGKHRNWTQKKMVSSFSSPDSGRRRRRPGGTHLCLMRGSWCRRYWGRGQVHMPRGGDGHCGGGGVVGLRVRAAGRESTVTRADRTAGRARLTDGRGTRRLVVADAPRGGCVLPPHPPRTRRARRTTLPRASGLTLCSCPLQSQTPTGCTTLTRFC